MLCCRELQTFIIAVYELSDSVSNWYSVWCPDVDWYLVMFIDIAPFSSRFLYIHTFLTYNESKFDSNVIKKYSEIIRPAGDISHFFATYILPRIYFHILGKRVPPLYCVQYFAKYFLVLEIFQPARLPGHFSSQRFHSFLCPSLRFLIRLSTFFSLIISYCVTVKWILPFSH